MTTRHLIDPDLIQALEMLPSFDFNQDVLPMIRIGFAAQFASAEVPDSPDVETSAASVTGIDGNPIGLLIHAPLAPSSAARPAVLHIHGGGYIIGSAAMSTLSNRAMAVAADCVIVSVDYRLSPETPHPGPVEDCYSALCWLHDNAASLGVDPARMAVMGESAGGGLAAGLALLARDRAKVKLVHQHLIYPMLDDRTCTRAPNPLAGEFVWTPASNHFGWSSLLGQPPGGEGVSPYAAAARVEDVRGLPSTFIYVGGLDLFVDEDVAYAMRLLRAGVPTELHLFPGATHAFEVALDSPLAKNALRISTQALRRALHPSDGSG